VWSLQQQVDLMTQGTSLPRTLGEGRYAVEAVIGEGGAATVVRALDTKHGVHRAIKLMQPGGDSERLLREYTAMIKLEHPNVLRVYAVDESVPFIVMALAASCVADHRLPVGPLVALKWVDQLLAALEVAHAQGIVHRDVKPENLLLDAQGNLLLADFGIARLDLPETRITRTGTTMGSFAFMAPEQRIDAKRAGPASDLYAVGATLFELLTGVTPTELYLVAAIDSERFEAVPEPARGVVWQATRARPIDRYRSAREMAEAVRAVRSALGDPEGRVPLPAPAHALAAPRFIEGELASTALPTIQPVDVPVKRRRHTTVVAPPSRRLVVAALLGGMAFAALALGCASLLYKQGWIGPVSAGAPAAVPSGRPVGSEVTP
jgi:serine/threonine protein kinase